MSTWNKGYWVDFSSSIFIPTDGDKTREEIIVELQEKLAKIGADKYMEVNTIEKNGDD